MTGYYTEKLSGRRLERCYELAPPRVQRYLEAEIAHAARRIGAAGRVLELGCGTGRIARPLAGRLGPRAGGSAGRCVVGIDTARESLRRERATRGSGEGIATIEMDAIALGFASEVFDAVVCLQNGIAAFGVDPESLLREALRVTRAGGIVLLSSYAERFWPERLDWFERQAAAGLLGPIDHQASTGGVIVCTDGFRAGRLGADDFRALCDRTGVRARIEEVDGSSLFCEIRK